MRQTTKLLGIAAVAAGLLQGGTAFASEFVAGTEHDETNLEFGAVFKYDQTFVIGNNVDKQGQRTGSLTHLRSGGNLRNAALDFSGSLTRDWAYSAGLDIDGSANIELDHAFITYKGFAKNFEISVGQVFPHFCLENAQSSKYIAFLERSMATQALTPCPGLGVMIGHWAPCYSINMAVTQPGQGVFVKNIYGNDVKDKSDRWAVNGRATYAPIHDDGRVLQFGLSGAFEDDSNDANLRFSTRPEARSRNMGKVLDTSSFDAAGNEMRIYANSHNMVNVELAGQYGPFWGEAEYIRTNVNRPSSMNLNNIHFHGYHVQAAYVITGEHRDFVQRNGTFGRVRPSRPCGAWEIAARHSYLSLNDENIAGGSGHVTTFSLSWWANDKVRVLGNFAHAHLQESQTFVKRNPNIIGLRFQYVF